MDGNKKVVQLSTNRNITMASAVAHLLTRVMKNVVFDFLTLLVKPPDNHWLFAIIKFIVVIKISITGLSLSLSLSLSLPPQVRVEKLSSIQQRPLVELPGH